MAIDMFLKLGGDADSPPKIKGESADSAHKDEIDVLAWSRGASNSSSSHQGGGRGAGKSNFQDLSITKYVDTASVDLLKFAATGKHIDFAQLTVRKAGGEQLEYVTLKFEKVLVTSVSTGGSGGEDRLTENVSLSFAEFAYVYTPQSQDGTAGKPEEFGWDIARNEEL